MRRSTLRRPVTRYLLDAFRLSPQLPISPFSEHLPRLPLAVSPQDSQLHIKVQRSANGPSGRVSETWRRRQRHTDSAAKSRRNGSGTKPTASARAGRLIFARIGACCPMCEHSKSMWANLKNTLIHQDQTESGFFFVAQVCVRVREIDCTMHFTVFLLTILRSPHSCCGPANGQPFFCCF